MMLVFMIVIMVVECREKKEALIKLIKLINVFFLMVKNGLVLPVHGIEMIKFNFQGENSALLKSYCLIRQTLIQETNFF